MNSIISKKIQRLPLSDAQKERLLEETKTLDEAKLQNFLELLSRQDDESIKILQERADAQNVLKDQLKALDPNGKSAPMTKEQVQTLLKTLEDIFTHPEYLSKFLAVTDDASLGHIETLLLVLLKNDSHHQEVFRKFFKEIRLQKAAFERQAKEKKDQEREGNMKKKQQLVKELEVLIDQGKKLLKNEKKKG